MKLNNLNRTSNSASVNSSNNNTQSTAQNASNRSSLRDSASNLASALQSSASGIHAIYQSPQNHEALVALVASDEALEVFGELYAGLLQTQNQRESTTPSRFDSKSHLSEEKKSGAGDSALSKTGERLKQGKSERRNALIPSRTESSNSGVLHPEIATRQRRNAMPPATSLKEALSQSTQESVKSSSTSSSLPQTEPGSLYEGALYGALKNQAINREGDMLYGSEDSGAEQIGEAERKDIGSEKEQRLKELDAREASKSSSTSSTQTTRASSRPNTDTSASNFYEEAITGTVMDETDKGLKTKTLDGSQSGTQIEKREASPASLEKTRLTEQTTEGQAALIQTPLRRTEAEPSRPGAFAVTPPPSLSSAPSNSNVNSSTSETSAPSTTGITNDNTQELVLEARLARSEVPSTLVEGKVMTNRKERKLPKAAILNDGVMKEDKKISNRGQSRKGTLLNTMKARVGQGMAGAAQRLIGNRSKVERDPTVAATPASTHQNISASEQGLVVAQPVNANDDTEFFNLDTSRDN